MNNFNDFSSASRIETVTDKILESIAESKNSDQFINSLQTKGKLIGSNSENAFYEIDGMYINVNELKNIFKDKTILRKKPKETFGLK